MQQKVGSEPAPGLYPVRDIAGLIEHQGPVAQAGNDTLVIPQDDKVQVEVGVLAVGFSPYAPAKSQRIWSAT